MESSHEAAFRREHRLWVAAAVITGLHTAAILAFLLPRLSSLSDLKLRYTAEFGVNWVDDWRMLGLFPAVAAVSVVVDWLLARRLRKLHPSMGETMAVAGVLVSLAFAVAGGIALLLNASSAT